jgi:hypothetical protein
MEQGALESFSNSSEFLSEREHERATSDYKNRTGKPVTSMDGVTVEEPNSGSHEEKNSARKRAQTNFG